MPQPASAPFLIGPGAIHRPRERRRAGRKETALRKYRVLDRLAAGGSHAAIAREENCSIQWIRRIIAEALQSREADPFEEFRKLQIARLSLALKVGHQALMDGKLAAIDPYLKTVKALDRYHGGKKGAEPAVEAKAMAVSGGRGKKSQRN
jgi:Mor family transcriptional regulator